MHDLSVTAIHHAVQLPTDPASIRCQQALAEANASTIDHVLKRIFSHLRHRNDRWPPRRLFRCLDYIAQHCRSENAILQLRSFRSCVKAALDQLAQGTTEQRLRNETNIESIHAVIKFIGSVLEHRNCYDVLLNDIRRSRGMMYVLQWTACPRLESTCLRTLVAKGKHFAKDLVAYDAFWILANLVNRVPDLPTNDPKVHLCVKAARIFENLMSFAKSPQADLQSREKAVSFVRSVNFIPLARSWQESSSNFLQHPANSATRKLMHSLTSIVSSCIAISKDAAASFSNIEAASVWRSTLSHDMKAFLNHIRQQQQDQPPFITTNIAMDEIAIRMLRIARIALGVAVSSGKDGHYRQSSADELTQDITVFLLLLGFDTVLPEHIAILGSPVTGSMHAWFGEYYNFDHGIINKAALFKNYQDFFVVLLECYIQHVQLASEWLVSRISGYISYFLTNAMATLKDDEQPDTSPVQARLEKLVSYFLYYDKAIQVFATAPTHLNDTIWSPTIQNAMHGLTLYVDNDIDMQGEEKHKHSAVLYKARRAFSALRAATKHPNACARMEQAGALQMVNINYIPNREELEQSVSLLNVYASFTHYIAALARTMALIRVKLRQDFPIGPVIMKLLWQANQCTFNENTTTGWSHVVSGCLMVVSAFEFDSESLQKWLSWPVPSVEQDETGWISTALTSSNCLSILPVVLGVLLPERNNWRESLQKRISNYENLLLHAVIAFNLLSMVPEAGIQLLRDHETIQHLCETLMELEKHARSIDCSSDAMPKLVYDVKLDEQEENQDNNSERISLLTKSPIMRCFDMLHRGLVRILTSRDNMNLIITSNVLTAFFQPLCTSMIEMDSFKLELSRMLCQDISDERLGDYRRLFQFTVGDDNATKLHELCAVATAYACPNAGDWDSVLGIRAGEEVIQSKSVFGALCRMLVYDLLEQDSDSVYEAPYRRPAAAQAIEVLVQVLTPQWVADREDIVVQLRQRIRNHPVIEDADDMVSLITHCSNDPVTTRRAPLVQQSTFFAALFSGEYAENASGNPIQLHDITNHALTMFLDVINRGGDAFLPSSMSWCDVADVLLAADRFGSESVRILCEEWISRNLVNKDDSERLDGAMLLFRRCRDPGALDAGISSDVWPFQKTLVQAFMITMSELSASTKTAQFNKMVQENDAGELSSFCQGMAVLICSSIRDIDHSDL
ncbi:hypothetical protein BJV82DRAFT_245122 [Fennellomyces sp. T-0311]|nr:hypothetical protein BJV82DRAFT_245122 [Fennellomyces sp. T-0311]